MKIEDQAREFLRETAVSSSLADCDKLESYQRLMEIGDPAIPVILEMLREQKSWLVVVLEGLVDESPVQPTSAGRLDRIVEDWLEWACRDE